MPIDINDLPPPPGPAINSIDDLPPPPGFEQPVAGLQDTSLARPAVPPPPPSSIDDLPPPPAQTAELPESDQGGLLVPSDKSGTIDDADIQRIAESTGADPQFIKDSAAYYGLIRSPDGVGDYVSQTAKGVVGGIGNTILSGLPQDAIKKFGVSDEKSRRALDELERLHDSRRSYVNAAADTATGAVAGLGASSKLAKGAIGLAGELGVGANVAKWIGRGSNVVSNASQGYLSSDEDNEIAGTAAMTALGLVAGPALKGASKVLGAGADAVGSAVNKVKKTASEILFDDSVGKVSVERVAERFAANQNAEEALARRVIDAPEGMDFNTFKQSVNPDEMQMLAGLSAKGSRGVTAVADDLEEAALGELGVVKDDVAAKAFSVYNTARKQLGQALGSGGPKGSIEGAIGREGQEFAAKRLEAIRKAEYLADELKEVSGGKELGDFGWGRRTFSWLADARYVYDMIDNRFGTEMAPALDKLSRAYNASTQVQTAALTQLRPIAKQLRALRNTTAADGTDLQTAIYRAIDSGDYSKLSEPQQAAAKNLADYFKTAADISESAHELFPSLGLSPIKVARRENYIPHALVDLPEMVVKLRQRIAAEGDALSDDTRKGLELFYGNEIRTPQDMRDALAKLATGKRSADAVRSSAGNLFERSEDAIPDFLLDKDLFKLATNWPSRTLRHQFLREGLGDMLSASDALSDTSPVLSEYVRNHAKDLLGTRSGTAADMTRQLNDKIKIWASTKANEASTPLAKGIYNTIGNFDGMSAAATSNMYSYYLGLRPDAVLRNLASVVTMTSTGLDFTKPRDLLPRIMASYAKAAKDTVSGKAGKDLADAGYVPADKLYEAQDALRGGVMQSPVAQLGKDAVEVTSRWAMKAYTAADTVTRAATKNLAETIAKDAVAGNEAALSHLVRVSPGYLSAIRRAIKSGDEKAVADLYSDYLLASTQFNYNRVSMSQMGRSMGHLFSMFSKWPTAVLGEIGGYVDSKAIGNVMPAATAKIMARYLTPLALTVGLQPLWEDAQEDVPAPIVGLVGKDIRKWFPSDTLGSLIELKVAKGSPVLVTAKDALVKLYDGDPAGALGVLADGAMGGLPMGTWLRLILQTGPEFINGEPILDLRGDSLVKKVTE